MKFEQGEFTDIVYVSESKGEVSQRTILPTFVPPQTIKSIDVSELNPEQRAELQALYKEYSEYYRNYLANAFNFETWVEHSKGIEISPKWRAFKLANIKQPL